jgi:Spy/CpxP family protein refolding chaperone
MSRTLARLVGENETFPADPPISGVPKLTPSGIQDSLDIGHVFNVSTDARLGRSVSPPDRMVSCAGARQDKPSMFRVVACVAVCLFAISVQAQSTHYKWWLAHDIQTQLHLTSLQVKKINDVFESTLAVRRAQRQELDTLDRQLDALLDNAAAEDRDAEALIKRVEDAHARRNVARTMMLYKMRQVLTPEQRRWFDTRAQSSDR